MSLLEELKNHKKSGFRELDDWANNTIARKYREIGYPVNQYIKLRQFYKWYIANNLEIVGLNNVGDPFSGKKGLLSAHELEKQVILQMSGLYGFLQNECWGLLCSSCTDGNNHGIYFGAKYLFNKTGKQPILYVSDEAHYSNARLGNLQNLETRLIKTDVMGRMIPSELEKELDVSRPCLMVYAIGSTFKGAIDDIKALNNVLNQHPDLAVYRHVDAALFGGYLPFTKYSNIVNCQKNKYESIAVSGHKFFGMDAPVGLFMTTRDIYDSQTQFNVPYLNDDMRMITCSRSSIDVLKFWWLLHTITHDQWCKQAETILENTNYLMKKLTAIDYPCWKNNYSNTVLIKRPPQNILDKYNLASSYEIAFGGDISHIVVMQHVTKKRIDEFVQSLIKSIE